MVCLSGSDRLAGGKEKEDLLLLDAENSLISKSGSGEGATQEDGWENLPMHTSDDEVTSSQAMKNCCAQYCGANCAHHRQFSVGQSDRQVGEGSRRMVTSS